MRFSDLSRRHAGMGDVSASVPSLPGGITAPAAVTNGSALFNKAYQAADGSLAGTAAGGAAIVAALPAGQFRDAVNSAVSILSAATAGAAAGSVIPGYGTAIGAVVGTIIGMVETIASAPVQSPEGEFRTKAEQYVFPALPLTPTVGESPSALAQVPIYPAPWPTIRRDTIAYQPVTDASGALNPAPPDTRAVPFDFGIGWVSPPQSTAASTQQAWYLGNAYMAGDWWGTNVVLPLDTTGTLASYGQQMENEAITALGSQQQYDLAKSLLTSWYETAEPAFNAAPWNGPLTSNWRDGTNVLQFGEPWSQFGPAYWKLLQELNTEGGEYGATADYTYYYGPYILVQDQSSPSGDTWVVLRMDPPIPPSTQGAGQGVYGELTAESGHFFLDIRMSACPDTTLLGLAEIASLVASGVIPQEGADVVAFHYVLALAWLWRRGQVTEGIGTYNHPNFSRILGILTAKIQGKNKQPSKATTTASKAALSSYAQIQKSVTKSSGATKALTAYRAIQQAAAPRSPSSLARAAPPTVVGPSPRARNEEIGASAVLLAAAAGAAYYLRKRRHST